MKRRPRALLAGLALALAPALAPGSRAASARAQEAPEGSPSVAVDVGFDGTFVDGAWTPVLVTLATPPRAPSISGRVVVEPLPLERVAAFSAPFALASSPAGARTRVLLAVPARGELAFSVRVEDEQGRELATQTPIRTHHVDLRDRLVLSTRSVGLGAFADQVRTGVAQAVAPQVQLARLGGATEDEVRERFPPRAWLLQGATAIVLAQAPGVRGLVADPDRMAAIEEWTRDGGTLFVVGGDAPFWAGTRLEPLLPVAAPGTRSDSRPGDLAFLGATRSTVVSDAVKRGELSTVLEGEPDHAIVAVRALGRGRVYFLAFDPDALGVRSAPELARYLRTLLGAWRGDALPVAPDRLAELSSKAFDELAPVSMPGLAAIALASLLAAAIAGPVAARRRGRPALGLLAPALSAALAGGIVAVARVTRPASEARALAYVFADAPSSGVAVLDLALAAGGATSFELELAPGALPLPLERPKIELIDFRARRTALELAPGEPLRLQPIDAVPRATAVVRVGGRVDLPRSLEARVRIEANELVIEDHGPEPLPAGMAVVLDRSGRPPACVETPVVAPRTSVRVSLGTTQDLGARLRDDAGLAPLWDRPQPEAEHALELRALGLFEPRLSSGRGPVELPGSSVWLALPGPLPELALPAERPRGRPGDARPVPLARRIAVYLFAAEGSP